MKKLIPLVKKNNGMKNARGFSINEIKLAKLTNFHIKKYNIPYDKRRKSFYNHNIELLKSTLNKQNTT